MSLKLEKIAAEREKARRKRDEWEERRKEWDRKYHEQENSEICEMVHAQSLTPEQLAVIIQMAQATVPNPENLKLEEKEEEEDKSSQQFITLVTKAGNTFYLIYETESDDEPV